MLTIAILLFLGHAQNPLHVVFGREQFYHFSLACLYSGYRFLFSVDSIADDWSESAKDLYRSIREQADSVVYVSRDYHNN